MGRFKNIALTSHAQLCLLGERKILSNQLTTRVEYLLVDKYKYKKPTHVPAKTYIDYQMKWMESRLENKQLFPLGKSTACTSQLILDDHFSSSYVDELKRFSKRCFRVYAHIFCSHIQVLREKNLDGMFYDSLTFFLFFIDMYSLVPSSELRPISPLVKYLVPDLKSGFLPLSYISTASIFRLIIPSHSASERGGGTSETNTSTS